MMYKNEIEFKKHLIIQLREAGAVVTPIQTRTVPGVPDLYVVHPWHTWWVECKCLPKQVFRDELYEGRLAIIKNYKIPFRPGQQAWAHGLWNTSRGKQHVVVAVAFANGVYAVQMTRIYNDGYIPATNFKRLTVTKEHCLFMEPLQE